MSAPGSFPPSAGRPFTIWLDPARWPVPPLKLPGRAFTLWQDPARWPQRICRLPGLGHTLWLDPARWPAPRLRLPAAGFTLWLDPEIWPRPVELSLPAAPQPSPVMPIQISRNNAFTLWTRPAQVTPIPMKNGLTAAQVAEAETPSPAVAPAMAAAPVSDPATSQVLPVPLSHRLLPLAAGIVAVMGLNAMVNVAKSKRDALDVSEVANLNQMIDQAGKGLNEMRASNAKTVLDFQEKAAQSEAKALVLKEENARLVTSLTQAQEALRKTESKAAGQEMLVRDLTTQTAEAKLAAATADTKAQSLVVAATEEASTIKREAAAEVVKLRESLALLEAEKAAALKAAATAAQEKSALQQTLDALKKPAP